MNDIRSLLEELRSIVSDYDSLLDYACGCGIFNDDEDFERMDNNRNRANEIIDQLEV